MSLTSVADLQNLISTRITQHKRLPEIEIISIAQAAGRVLAQDMVSPLNIPSANISAMDGYALAHEAKRNTRLSIVGESSAGHPFSGSVTHGQCVRIMTGAVVPPDCITVVLQENTVLNENGEIIIQQDISAAQNIRYAGEEIKIGTLVLHQGRILRHADIMLLASLGFESVAVYRRLRVAILSTGDELTEVGTPLTKAGQIYDSNRQMLMSRLSDFPVEIIDLKKVEDNLEDVMRTLDAAANENDVVITSGGVSVGDYDYLRQAVERLGAIHHYKVAMKPGKPFVFGQMLRAWYFGLPGNPISGFVGFDMFVKSALWQLCGATHIPQPLRFQAMLTAPIKKAIGRMDIQRATITQQADGTWTAQPCGAQDSHRIFGASQANAYIILPQDVQILEVGETVVVQPFLQTFL